jgi:hypothetical protein
MVRQSTVTIVLELVELKARENDSLFIDKPWFVDADVSSFVGYPGFVISENDATD